MRQYLKLLTLMGFFSALYIQNAHAAAVAGTGEFDSDHGYDRVSKLIATNTQFAASAREILSGNGIDSSVIDLAMSTPEGFNNLLSEDHKHAVFALACAAEEDQKAGAERLAADEATTADLVRKMHFADAATAGVGTRFDCTHPIFPRVMALSQDVQTKSTAFLKSLKGCYDWDVHKFNKERVSNVGADKLLFNGIMPGLAIKAGSHAENIARVRAHAEKIYEGAGDKIASVNKVLESLKEHVGTGEDGLEPRPIHAAMAQVLTLAEMANSALSEGWLRLFLDKIAENKETAGGCMPGIMGRLVEVGMRTFGALSDVAPTAVGISNSGFVAASGGSGGSYAEVEDASAAGAGAAGGGSGGGFSALDSKDILAGATDDERATINSVAGHLGIDLSTKSGALDAYRGLVESGLSGDALTEKFTAFLFES